MSKLLSLIVAATFAVVSVPALAASHTGGMEKKDEKKAAAKKSDKKAAPKKSSDKKAAPKTDKKAADKSAMEKK